MDISHDVHLVLCLLSDTEQFVETNSVKTTTPAFKPLVFSSMATAAFIMATTDNREVNAFSKQQAYCSQTNRQNFYYRVEIMLLDCSRFN